MLLLFQFAAETANKQGVGWSLNRGSQSVLHCYNCKFSGLTLDLLIYKFSWQGPEICVLASPPGDSDTCQSLRTGTVEFDQMRKQFPPVPLLWTLELNLEFSGSSLKVSRVTYSLYLLPFGWGRSQTGTQWAIILLKGKLCCSTVTKLCVLFLTTLGCYSGHGQIITKIWLLVYLKNGTLFLFLSLFFF